LFREPPALSAVRETKVAAQSYRDRLSVVARRLQAHYWLALIPGAELFALPPRAGRLSLRRASLWRGSSIPVAGGVLYVP
jgi:hypothetical protein